MSSEPPKRRRRVRDIAMAVLSLVFGLWLVTYGQKEWSDDAHYRVKTKLLGSEGMVLSDEIKTGKEMNRSRMIFGVVALVYGGYLTFALLRRTSPSPMKKEPNQ